jgi:hypothetical protein
MFSSQREERAAVPYVAVVEFDMQRMRVRILLAP